MKFHSFSYYVHTCDHQTALKLSSFECREANLSQRLILLVVRSRTYIILSNEFMVEYLARIIFSNPQLPDEIKLRYH